MNWETFFVAVGYFVLFLIAYTIIALTVTASAQNKHRRAIELMEARTRTGISSQK